MKSPGFSRFPPFALWFPVMAFSTFLFGASEHFGRGMDAGANKRPGADAEWPLLFAYSRARSRTTQPGC
jgi:hypothetical protein